MTMLLPVKTILYHGTAQPFDVIDVTKGKDRKDFGKGFYMALSKEQAIGMMHKKYKEIVARRPNSDISKYSKTLYEIHIDTEYVKTLNVRIFNNADSEWLDFILMCREKGGIPHNYDLVIGPTADDDTMLCLNSYWRGFYGEVGSEQAKEKLLNYLEPENLGYQYYVGKQNIIEKLVLEIKNISWN